MAAAVLLTAMLGLDGLVAILSKVAPLIVAVCIAVGISGIVRNPGGVADSADTLASLDVLQAAPHWAISGLNFPALGILMLVPFLASLGRKVRNDAEAVAGEEDGRVDAARAGEELAREPEHRDLVVVNVAGYPALVLVVCIAVRHVRNVRNRRLGRDVYAVEFERVPEEEAAAAARG